MTGIVPEDEYDVFCNHVAAEIKEMAERDRACVYDIIDDIRDRLS